MKLFEYLLSGRVIIASDTPAIREIVSGDEVLFYRPDDAKDLSAKVRYAMAHQADIRNLEESAGRKGTSFSWNRRAERIVTFLEKTMETHL